MFTSILFIILMSASSLNISKVMPGLWKVKTSHLSMIIIPELPSSQYTVSPSQIVQRTLLLSLESPGENIPPV